MLGTKEKGWWDAKSREFDDQNGEGTCGGRNEKNDGKPPNMKGEVVIWLCATRFTCVSSGEAIFSGA